MEQTFYDFSDSTLRFVTEWNNTLLGMPNHLLRVLLAANELPAIGERFVNGFDNPASYFDWLVSPDEAAAFLEQVAVARPSASLRGHDKSSAGQPPHPSHGYRSIRAMDRRAPLGHCAR